MALIVPEEHVSPAFFASLGYPQPENLTEAQWGALLQSLSSVHASLDQKLSILRALPALDAEQLEQLTAELAAAEEGLDAKYLLYQAMLWQLVLSAISQQREAVVDPLDEAPTSEEQVFVQRMKQVITLHNGSYRSAGADVLIELAEHCVESQNPPFSGLKITAFGLRALCNQVDKGEILARLYFFRARIFFAIKHPQAALHCAGHAYVHLEGTDSQTAALLRLQVLLLIAEIHKSMGDLNQELKVRQVAWDVLNSPPFADDRKLDPVRAEALINVAHSLHQLGDIDQATEIYRHAWEDYYQGNLSAREDLDDDRARLLMNWGLALKNRGDLEDAVECYLQAWEAYYQGSLSAREEWDPDRANLLMNWGLALKDRGDFDGAVERYQLVWEAYYQGSLSARGEWDSDRAGLLMNWGIALKNRGDLDGAVERYRHAWEAYYQGSLSARGDLDPERAWLLVNWGLALWGRGDLEGAVERYQQAWEAYYQGSLSARGEWDPDRANLLMNWGLALQDRGDFDGAVERYQLAWEAYYQRSLSARGEWDSDRAGLLMNWGIALKNRGDLDGAVERYQQAWEAYYQGSLSGRGEWDSDRAGLQMNWGNALQRRGDLEGAMEHYRHAWKVYDQGNLSARRELDPSRARLLTNWGSALSARGDLEGAVERYQQAWEGYYQGSLSARGDLDPERACLLMDWGSALSARGDLEGAVERCQQAWEGYYQGSLSARGELDPARATLLMRWGNILQQEGDLEGAVECYLLAWKAYYQGSLSERGELDPDRATLLMNWGSVLLQQGDLEGAVEPYQHAWDIYNQGSLSARMELDPGRAQLLINWGSALLYQGDLEGAVERYQQAWDCYYQGSLSVRRELDPDRAKLLMNWSNALQERGDIEGALDLYRQAESCLQPSLERGWIDPELFKFFCRWFEARVAAEALDLSSSLATSQVLAQQLELCHWRKRKHGEHLAAYWFTRFHFVWFQACIARQAFDEIPIIVSALQGRKLMQLVFDELDGSSSKAPEAVQMLKACRQQIWQLSEAFQQLARAAAEVDDSRRAALVEQHKALTKTYEAAQSHYQNARQAVEALPDYRALAAPFQPLGVEQLGGVLAPGQALVMLLDITVDSKRRLQTAWLLRAGQPARCIPLRVEFAGLTGGFAVLKAFAVRQCGSLRKGPDSDAPVFDAQATTWEALAQAQYQQIWQPLESNLKDVNEIVLITQGRFHNLALDMGSPTAVTLRHYPGLFLFHQAATRQVAPQEAPQTPRVKAMPYQGEDLPLAPHELALINDLVWQQADALSSGLPAGGSAEPIDLLAFSGHGASAPAEPLNSCLVLDNRSESGNRLGFHQILQLPYRPRQVLLSTCVAGETHEDDDGDPIGIVSAFMLTGTRQVLASIANVPDSYMSLLMLLTEKARQRQRCDLAAALALAKSHLEDWPEHPLFADLATPYQAWLKRIWTCYWYQWPYNSASSKWLTQFCAQSDGMSERGQRNHLHKFITQDLGNVFAVQPEPVQVTILALVKATDQDVSHCAEQAVTLLERSHHLANPPSLIPPPAIAALLRAVVKVFG